MQTINAILKIDGGKATFSNELDDKLTGPEITIGVDARLLLDLRGVFDQGSAKLLPYPYEELENLAGWYIALDSDYLQETEPKLLRFSGIEAYQENGLTYLSVSLPNTARESLIKAVKSEKVSLYAEIAGYKADASPSNASFVLNFNLGIRNRVYLGDISGEPPEDDPEYLTTPQIKALLAAGFELQFSSDGETPVAVQRPEDKYYRFRSKLGGEWSDWIILPEGAAAPYLMFQYSPAGGDNTWRDEYQMGDLYIRHSVDGGENWSPAMRFSAGNALFPESVPFTEDESFADRTIVRFGTPAGTYQTKDITNPGESPLTHPAKWRTIAAPGDPGIPERSTAWLSGDDVPAADLGVDGDFYLAASGNFYFKNNAQWLQQGSLKGRDGIGFRYRGMFDITALYLVGDAVSNNGSLWHCKSPSSGITPVDGDTWELVVARGNPGIAGTIRIAYVTMLDQNSNPTVTELANSSPENRLYTIGIPRGSAGITGTIQLAELMELPVGSKPYVYELSGSTQNRRIYGLALPGGIEGKQGKSAYDLAVENGYEGSIVEWLDTLQGPQGEGLRFDAWGPLDKLHIYDSAVRGFVYLVTDEQTDADGCKHIFEQLYRWNKGFVSFGEHVLDFL